MSVNGKHVKELDAERGAAIVTEGATARAGAAAVPAAWAAKKAKNKYAATLRARARVKDTNEM